MEVIEKYETVKVRASVVRNPLTKLSRYYIGGKENVKVSNMRLSFNNTEQVDALIDQLLEVRNTLEK